MISSTHRPPVHFVITCMPPIIYLHYFNWEQAHIQSMHAVLVLARTLPCIIFSTGHDHLSTIYTLLDGDLSKTTPNPPSPNAIIFQLYVYNFTTRKMFIRGDQLYIYYENDNFI